MVRKVESWLRFPLELSKRERKDSYSSQFMYDFCRYCPKLFHLFRWTIKKLGSRKRDSLGHHGSCPSRCFLKTTHLGHCRGDRSSRVQVVCRNQLQTILNHTNIPIRVHDWFCTVRGHCIPWDSLLKCSVYHSNLQKTQQTYCSSIT